MIKRVARIVKWVLFALALFWAASCLWQSAKGFLHENNSHEECSRAPEYADLVAGMVGRNLGYVATESRDLDPTDRERVVYMSWEISPGTVTPISPDMVPSWQGPLVGPAGATEEAEDRYEACGFYVMACNESAVLRSRVNFQPDPREDHAPMDMSFRSLLGVLVAMFMLLCAWLRLRGDGKTSVVTAAFALAVFVALASASLRYGLTSPNGLATYAGKAKLFLLAHGVPSGFFTDRAYAVYQPAYPPGMVIPAIISFLIGGCGNFWLQLFVPFVLALLFVELAGRPTVFSVSLAAAYVLCLVAQGMAIGYYAEPLCALVLVMGWRAVRQGRTSLGWTLVGCAGLVRPEGLLLAMAALCLHSIGERRLELGWIFAAVAPGMIWQLLMTALGAGLQGYDFTAGPSFEHLTCFAEHFVSCLANGVNGSGVALCACLLILGCGRIRTGLLLLASWIAVVAVGGILVACSESVHFEWILEMLLGRYMWLVSAVLVCEAWHAQGRVRGWYSPRTRMN